MEDTTKTPNRWYKPAIILASDGKPEGETESFWQNELEKFVGEGNTAKAQKFSLAIGADALRAKNVLIKFAGSEKNMLFAENAADIVKWFEFLSKTVTDRVSQKNPDIFSIGDTSVFGNMEMPDIFKPNRTSSNSRKTRKTNVTAAPNEEETDY